MELKRYGSIESSTGHIRIYFKWEGKLGSVLVFHRTRTDAAKWLWRYRKARRWVIENLGKECEVERFSLRWFAMRNTVICVNHRQKQYNTKDFYLKGAHPYATKFSTRFKTPRHHVGTLQYWLGIKNFD